MKISLIYLIIITLLFQIKNISANEVEIISDNINILENGNKIESTNTQVYLKNKGLYIESERVLYDKIVGKLNLDKNVKFIDELKDITVNTKSAIYSEKRNILITKKATEIKIGNNYRILSKNLFYDRNLQKIYSSDETSIIDLEGNVYNLEDNFTLNLSNEIISTNKLNIIDIDNNIYSFENAKINLVTKEIIGKELRIDFEDGYFGNPNNDPVLKGRSALSNQNTTKIYKTVFSTCDTEDKNCPGWEIETSEFTHDKKNKVFNYKNSWLKIFGKEIFYFPFFSHPDPTVKRKSGFLIPYYGSSNNYGSWLNIPYFKTLGEDKDITFNPRVYADDKFILQSEYRQNFRKTEFISDFSYNNDGKNSNSHLFAKLTGKFDASSDFHLSYQGVSNDNYLKIHNLGKSSSIIDDESVLTSKFSYAKEIDENTKFISDFIAYEDLSKKNNDRFQYILPNFSFIKNLEIDKDYNGSFEFKSSGFQKNYDTNKYETLLINDFLFKSNDYISDSGFVTNYDFLIKNFNSYTENSIAYKEKEDYEVFGSFLIKSSFPLRKLNKTGNDYLKPIASFRYSPNNTKNISEKDYRLDYDNIFSINRIGTNEIVEGGKSISIGVEFEKKNKKENKILGVSLANSISDRKNDNLPIKTKLNEKRTDLVGKISLYPNQILNLDYSFSFDNNLKNSNYDSLSAKINYGFISSNFNFLSTGGVIGNDEIISNSTNVKIDEEKSLKLNIAKDLNKDFTEYYDLTYVYKSDCLEASIEYNKTFYKDGSLKPEKSLFLALKFIPFAEFRQMADINE